MLQQVDWPISHQCSEFCIEAIFDGTSISLNE